MTMAKEVKIGVGLLAVLVATFSYVLYNRVTAGNLPPDAASRKPPAVALPTPNAASPTVLMAAAETAVAPEMAAAEVVAAGPVAPESPWKPTSRRAGKPALDNRGDFHVPASFMPSPATREPNGAAELKPDLSGASDISVATTAIGAPGSDSIGAESPEETAAGDGSSGLHAVTEQPALRPAPENTLRLVPPGAAGNVDSLAPTAEATETVEPATSAGAWSKPSRGPQAGSRRNDPFLRRTSGSEIVLAQNTSADDRTPAASTAASTGPLPTAPRSFAPAAAIDDPYAQPATSPEPAPANSYQFRQPSTAAAPTSPAPITSTPLTPESSAAATPGGDYTPPRSESAPPRSDYAPSRSDYAAPRGEYAPPPATSRAWPGTNTADTNRPSEAAPPERITVRDGKYTVEPNDNYWIVSQKVYGTGGYFKAIHEHNRRAHPRPDRLQIGDVLAVPDAEVLRKQYPDLCPKPRKVSAPRSVTSSVSTRLRGPGRTYIVHEGDTLFDIARLELGKASRWKEIFDLNRQVLGDDFDYVKPGTELFIPIDGGQPDNVTRQPSGNPLR